MKKVFIIISIIIVVIVGIGVTAHFVYSKELKKETLQQALDLEVVNSELLDSVSEISDTHPVTPVEALPPITYLETPKPLKAFYISSWVTATPRLYNPIISFIEKSEINAVIIDIKDDTGRVSFLVNDQRVSITGSPENRIRNIRQVLTSLKEKNIYVIGRIAVFQDPYLTKKYPEWSLKNKTTGDIWKDRKGLSFLNPAEPEVWNYMVALAQASFDVGFDEINFDYIRYPSDGIIAEIDYQLEPDEKRSVHIRDFFAFLHQELKQSHPDRAISADLFGLTTTAQDDLGIGQIWEDALPYFDYLAPMVYPSHYASGSFGITKPAEEPYKIIKQAMEGAIKKTETAGFSREKIRPWLQDFNLGATYDVSKIQAQIQAVGDAGLESWMMWDPANTYTYSAYQNDDSVIE